MGHVPEWRKSSYTANGTDPACIEAATLHRGGIRVRDSKLELRAQLAIPTHAWADFISHAAPVA
ncbi:DUF397 domain-containing protein [Streptomyces sp. UNOC14_S4]|uniref:DUF397 domain-containing protein n=1 Tax=Streptomyces sp. UNOC14_S4 TaxID=2872340 RepID=UPI001E393A4A|nr:DUF397 domain-containing protein [Streptomyces sp. UNOC14_S4]MCC3768218.1 DUF397 domain-containing protein [Streptomyces sp. UNOC14_S4]